MVIGRYTIDGSIRTSYFNNSTFTTISNNIINISIGTVGFNTSTFIIV